MLRPHRTQAGHRRTVTFVVAAALHVAGVVALVAFTPGAAKKIAEAIPLKIIHSPAIAPKLGGGGETASTPKRVKKVKADDATVQPPTVVPDPIADEPDATEVANNDVADSAGEGGGPSGSGVPWGDPDSECIGEGCVEGGIPGALPGGPNPVFIDRLGITPIPLFQPTPPYPAAARATNLTGTVIVEIIVGADGHVQSARLVRSQSVFDAVALETVRKWRYQPVVVAGRPIVWKSQVSLRFQLR